MKELLCTKSVDLLPPKGRPKSLPTQKVLYVNILPGYDADMRLGFEKLRDLVKMYYPASTVDVRICGEEGRVFVPELEFSSGKVYGKSSNC